MAYNFVSQYNLEANSNDTIGANNGTDTAISYVAGIKGNCASFNGTTSKITASSLGTIFGNNDWYISLWVKPETTGTDRSIITNSAGNFGIGFGNTGKIWIRGIAGTYAYETGTSIANSSWQHFILQMRVFEDPPATFNYRMAIYKNKTFIEEFTTVDFVGSGNAQFGVSGGSSYFYKGLIDHITLGTGILAQGEINALYNGGIPPDIPFQNNFFPLF